MAQRQRIWLSEHISVRKDVCDCERYARTLFCSDSEGQGAALIYNYYSQREIMVSETKAALPASGFRAQAQQYNSAFRYIVQTDDK